MSSSRHTLSEAQIAAQRAAASEPRASMPREPMREGVVAHTNGRVVLIDGFVDADVCEELTQYLTYKLDHDGFTHNNKNAAFSNVLVPVRAVDNARVRALTLDIVDRIRVVAERGFVDPLREVAPEHFDNTVTLFNDSADLVRWSDASKNEAGLGVHADNQFFPHPEREHYSAHRDISAVLYLNDDFEGGKLTFPTGNASVPPKRGRLVVFGAGVDFLHSVAPVTSGTRFAMPTWWTYGNRPERRVRKRDMPTAAQSRQWVSLLGADERAKLQARFPDEQF